MIAAFPQSLVLSEDEIRPTPHTGINLEADQVARYFAGKTWDQVTLADLDQNYVGDASACLGFMTSQAFRYFLPAYLCECVRWLYEADVTFDTTLRRLTPSASSLAPEGFSEFTDALSQMQKSAIAHSLSYISRCCIALGGHDSDFAGSALKEYWGDFF